jgi:hypothetical protein
VLAQRTASEGPRWTRAVEDQSAPIPREITSKRGGIISAAQDGAGWVETNQALGVIGSVFQGWQDW